MRCPILRYALGGSLGLLALVPFLGGRADTVADRGRLRRPVALAVVDEGRTLLVANERSGTLSVIDVEKRQAVGEIGVGRQLTDLATTPDGKRLLVVDQAADELIVLERQGALAKVAKRIPVAAAPVSVSVTADGSRAYVASLWSRRLSEVDLSEAGKGPRVLRTLDLPLLPHKQVITPDGARLVLADSFNGRLAVVDLKAWKVDSLRTLPAHNIRGLTLSADGKELLLAHQTLRPQAHTTADDIHWGNLLTNNLRMVPVSAAVNPDADPLRLGWLHELGTIGNGAGDPAGLAVGTGGALVISVAGTGEILVGQPGEGTWARLRVGRRPTAVAVSGDGRRAFVAATLSDSVALVDVAGRKVEADVALGETAALGPADRGELLFHDARLSLEGWMSCQSCHTDGHSNGQLNDNQSDGSFDTPKRVLSLRGVKDTGPWAWDGHVTDLRGQIRQSIRMTMRGPEPSPQQEQDLEAFLRTLPPPPPLARAVDAAQRDAIDRGKAVFGRLACAGCHAPPLYTTPKVYDVGLSDEAGKKLFNPPSLRGVAHGGPFFHDGRAPTLEAVFTQHHHQIKEDMSKADRDDLLRFLRSL